MDLTKIITDLRQELQQIEHAIISLERLTLGRGRRRGRPSKWMLEAQRLNAPVDAKKKPEYLKVAGPKRRKSKARRKKPSVAHASPESQHS
jgi:hypothetical protein